MHARQLLYLPLRPCVGFFLLLGKFRFNRGEHVSSSPTATKYALEFVGSHGGQHIWCALDKLHPGKTPLITMVSPLPGKDLCTFLYSAKLISPLKSS